MYEKTLMSIMSSSVKKTISEREARMMNVSVIPQRTRGHSVIPPRVMAAKVPIFELLDIGESRTVSGWLGWSEYVNSDGTGYSFARSLWSGRC